MNYLLYHMIAFLAGFVIDLIVGDPYCLPHPIRWIGNLIAKCDHTFLKIEEQSAKKQRRRGVLLVVVVLLATVVGSSIVLIISYLVHPYVGIVMETIMTYYILATKCLRVESMKVYCALAENDVEKARYAVSMIVGRDTECLDKTGIAKAAIETVAENASDGVIAPMLYTAIGGPIIGFFYKAVNTMDSMVGYRSDRYQFFGTAAARMDDVLNFIPSRFCAWLFIIVSLFGKDYHAKDAYRIFKRDRYCHKSPNSAQTESACAGALGIQLAGDASYFGKVVSKPTIGDATRVVETEDIKRVNRLMYRVAFLCEILCVAVMAVIILV